MFNTLNNDALEAFNVKQLIELLDLIPGLVFWIKNTEGQFQYVNQAFLQHSKKSKIEQVLGRTDYHIAPAHLAKQFVLDDVKVLEGQSVTERLEVNVSPDGGIAWFLTSKRTLRNKLGKVIGTFGITRHIEASKREDISVTELQRPIEYIKANFSQLFTIKDLAAHSHLSVSALERRFKKYLNKTPLQFINKCRLEHASKLLVETNKSIFNIAYECGFTDTSYFGKQFTRRFNQSPSEYRKRIRSVTTD